MSDTASSHLHDIERAELERSFRAILSTSEGKRVLNWMLEQAAIYVDAYSGENAATNYVLGQQSVGRRLIGMLDELDPRAYPQLLLSIADLREIDREAAKAIADSQKENDDNDPEFF